jgi:hypothetical protein
MAELSKKERQFWVSEMEMLDRLYKGRLDQWQKTYNHIEMKFGERIRDLDVDEVIKLPLFATLLRQQIASIAFNYPKLFFTVRDQEGTLEIEELLERGAASLLELMCTKDHVHQAIYDALTTPVGWLRIDVNPPGDEIIAPYVANDAMEEDLTAVSRVPPAFVQLDPMCPPHKFGHARYIREKMWVPVKYLLDEDGIKNKKAIKDAAGSAAPNNKYDLGHGEVMNSGGAADPEQDALRAAIDNGDYIQISRIHERENKKLITFADKVEEEIKSEPHPFRKQMFPQRINSAGQPIINPETQEPELDLGAGQDASGWLVENGFPFIPIKFGMHYASFYSSSHLELLTDLMLLRVESVSRQANDMKRSARQGLVQRAESENNPELKEGLRKGRDGDWHDVDDVNTAVREITFGGVPAAQYALEDRATALYNDAASISGQSQGGASGSVQSATKNALDAADSATGLAWMESKVSGAYEAVTRNSFQIMASPQFTPENFAINVAPDGEEKFVRALRSADFLWNYRIEVQAGSMQPLIEELEKENFFQFYDRANASQNFDKMELDKRLAAASRQHDVEKLMIDDTNIEAQRAAQLENQRMISQMSDPGVLPEQDHTAHMGVHQTASEDPSMQELMMRVQSGDQSAQMQLQQVGQVLQQHMQQHQAVAEQAQQEMISPQRGAARGSGGRNTAASIIGQVSSNAQKTSDVVTAQAMQEVGSNGSF